MTDKFSLPLAFVALFSSWPAWCQRAIVPLLLAFIASYCSLLLYITTINMWWSHLFNFGGITQTAFIFAVPGWIAAFTRVKPMAWLTMMFYGVAGSIIYEFIPISMWGLVTQLIGMGCIFFVLSVQERVLGRFSKAKLERTSQSNESQPTPSFEYETVSR